MDDGHCPAPFGTATGAFAIGTHHDASLAYPEGQDPTLATGAAAEASSSATINARMRGMMAPAQAGLFRLSGARTHPCQDRPSAGQGCIFPCIAELGALRAAMWSRSGG